MEFNKPMDVYSFDWDDSELIEAYDRAMNNEKASSKTKKGKNGKKNVKEEKVAKNWKIGDYCRAIYAEDGLYYEAVVVDVQEKSCSVEFLGYGDCVEVSLDSIMPSLGKKARQKQRKSVKKAEQSIYTVTSDTDYNSMNDSKDVSRAVKSGHAPIGNTTVEQCNHSAAAGFAQHHPQGHMPQHSAPPTHVYGHAMHAPMVSVPDQNMGGAAHCLPPPPPVVPPCTASANDPALSAMLVSWYMAGYYSGLHQSQKSSHCHAVPKPHCCGHQAPNHCGHFC